MLEKMSLKTKLLCSYIFCSLCLMVVGWIGYSGLKQTSEKFSHVSNVNLENMSALGKMQTAQRDVIIAVSLLLGTHASSSDVNASKDMTEKAIKTFEDAAKIYENIPFVPGEEEQWNEAKKNWQPFKELSLQLISLSASGLKEDETKRDQLGGKEFVELKQDIILKIGKLYEFQVDEKNKWTAQAHDASASSIKLSFTVSVAGVLLSMLFGFFVSTRLNKTLKKITQELATAAEVVTSTSQQVSAAGHELSSAVREQAAAIQETSATVEEMSAMTQKNAENATQSQNVAMESQRNADRGNEAIANMQQAMNDIDIGNDAIMTEIEESNRNISEIVKVISEIGNKTKVINEIVFQTKLLSFNASVEAARAGDHGKGFAVVAEEVGNLAQMSGNAAKDISSMLDASIKKVEEIVQQTKSKVERQAELGKEKVQRGTEVAKNCGSVLDEMAKSVSKVSALVGEISVASKEQATGVEQINQAIRQLDIAIQQSATTSDETANAAHLLSAQACALRNLADTLTRTVNGDDGSEHSEKADKVIKQAAIVPFQGKPVSSGQDTDIESTTAHSA